MNMQTTRRALLGSMAFAPIAGAAMASTTAPPSSSSAAWDRTMAAYLAAKMAYERHSAEIYEPALAKLDRIAPRPDAMIEITALNGQTARFRVIPTTANDDFSHWGANVRKRVAKIVEAHQRRVEALAALGIDAIEHESEALSSRMFELENELGALPAPNLAALLWKIENYWGEDARTGGCSQSWTEEVLDPLLADARRLLGQEVKHG